MNVIDCGVVLYLTKTAGATDVKNIDGTTFPSVAISPAGPPSAWQESAYRQIGKGQLASWNLTGVLQAGVQSVKVRAETLRLDTNLTLWNWRSIQTVRSDTGAPAAEHTISPANLISIFDITKGRDLELQSTDTALSGKVRLIVQFQAALDNLDKLIAALMVLIP